MNADTALVVIDAQIGVGGEAYHHDEVLRTSMCCSLLPAVAGRQ